MFTLFQTLITGCSVKRVIEEEGHQSPQLFCNGICVLMTPLSPYLFNKQFSAKSPGLSIITVGVG